MIDLNDAGPQVCDRIPGPTPKEIAEALRPLAQAVVERLRGGLVRTKGYCSPNEVRYGNRGSLVVHVGGSDQGLIMDHEAGRGMDPIRFIMQELGCDYRDAIRWAKVFLGLGDPEDQWRRLPATSTTTRAARPTVEGDAIVERYSRHWWKLQGTLRTVRPAAGTPAETYLQRRGITEIPACVGWSDRHRSAVMLSTDDSGEVQAIQLVHLTADGKKERRDSKGEPAGESEGRTKTTNKGRKNWSSVAAMRCDAKAEAAADVIVLAEGPETTLAIWVATGMECWSTFGVGNLGKAPIPSGKRVVIALDNGAEKHVNKALAALTARGIKATVAVPPTDKPKGDFNDVLVESGPEAVRKAILAALQPELKPFYPDGAIPAAEATTVLIETVNAFFAEALAPQDEQRMLDLNATAPVCVGIRAGAGLGKTEAVLDQVARPEWKDKYISYYGPSHELNEALAARFRAKSEAAGGPRCLVIRGRDQKADDGRPMCAKADITKQVAMLGHPVQETCCRRKLTKKQKKAAGTDEAFELCEHYTACPYIAQMADDQPAVRIMPHQYAFQRKLPEHLLGNLNIIDESFWKVSLRGVEEDYSIPLDSITRMAFLPKGKTIEEQADIQRLKALSEILESALAKGKASPEALRRAGLTPEDASFASGMWYSQVEELGITPSMPAANQRKRLEAYRTQFCLKLGRFWRLIAEELQMDRAELRSIAVALGQMSQDNIIYDKVSMVWSEDLTISEAPTLLIDADLDAGIVRRFLPHMREPVVINAERVNAHVTQITDRSVSKESIGYHGENEAKLKTAANNTAKLCDFLAAEANATDGEVLCITYQATETALREMDLPKNISLAHFNAIRGLDYWKGVASVVVAGRTEPAASQMEKIARALFYKDATPLSCPGEYMSVQRGIRMADGGVTSVWINAHPDATVDMLLRQTREAELAQAVDRARLVHRRTDQPCRVVIMTHVPIDITVHAVTTWDALIPDVMAKLTSSPAVPLSDSELARCFQNFWKDAKAAENWRRYRGLNTLKLLKETLIGDSGYLIEAEYRRPGQRGKSSAALIDTRQPDLRDALESVVGVVAKFELRPCGDAPKLEPSAWLQRTVDMAVIVVTPAEFRFERAGEDVVVPFTRSGDGDGLPGDVKEAEVMAA